MTEATEDHQSLATATKPTVFRHDGRRLFLIDGEPRIVDVDIGEGLGLVRDRKVRDLITRQIANLSFFGPLLKADMTNGSVVLVSRDGESALPHDGAMASEIIAMIGSEGLLAATGGRRPMIWFLTKDQMRWIVTKSETEQADEFQRELFRVYKAWEDGTLEPARPAVEPPKPAAAPQPARIALAPRMEFGHRDGVVFATGDDRPHVLGDSVAEALGLTVGELSAELAKWPQLASLGEMPVYEGRHGFYLNKAHVTFLMSRSGAFLADCRTIAAVLEALDERKAYLHDGEVHFRDRDFYVSCERDARKLAEAVERGRWLPAPSAFLRCRHGFLRMRHDRVAHFFHRTAEGVAADVRRLREAIEDDRARVLERFGE